MAKADSLYIDTIMPHPKPRLLAFKKGTWGRESPRVGGEIGITHACSQADKPLNCNTILDTYHNIAFDNTTGIPH